jgi:hypothetical protein
MLDRELTARKIPRPVVMLTDNHASRKAEIVLAYCIGDCKRHGSEADDLTEKCTCRIRQHFEPTTVSNLYQNTVCQHFDSEVKNRPAASSGFLQALDQFNKKFHMAYNKERKRYQKIRRMNSQPETINTADFFTIVSQIWPFWSTPSDRRVAFQKVGILQNRLDASLVDRSKFTAIMPEPPAVSPSFGECSACSALHAACSACSACCLEEEHAQLSTQPAHASATISSIRGPPQLPLFATLVENSAHPHRCRQSSRRPPAWPRTRRSTSPPN